MVGAWSANGFLGSWLYLEIFREAKVRCLKDMFLGALCEETLTKTVCTTELIWGFLREMISATEKIITAYGSCHTKLTKNSCFFSLLQVLTSILWRDMCYPNLSYPLTCTVTGGGRRIRIGRWRWWSQWSWRGRPQAMKFDMILKLSSSMAWKPNLPGIFFSQLGLVYWILLPVVLSWVHLCSCHVCFWPRVSAHLTAVNLQLARFANHWNRMKEIWKRRRNPCRSSPSMGLIWFHWPRWTDVRRMLVEDGCRVGMKHSFL